MSIEQTDIDKLEIIGSDRYRVEKSARGFWPFCVRAGDGQRELFVGHRKQCEVVAAELATAFEDGKFSAASVATASEAMNHNPAAWLVPLGDYSYVTFKNDELTAAEKIPLYFHPAPAAEESDKICVESDGCPTEMAVLKRFWRQHHNKSGDLQALQRDAGRYRFLRTRIAESQLNILGAKCSSNTVDSVDAGIDSAMVARQQNGEDQ